MLDENDPSLVALRVCNDTVEASAIRTFLAANGIGCVVQGEQHRSMLGMLGAYIEPRVLVAPGDLERAKELLAEVESGAAEIGPEEALQDELARGALGVGDGAAEQEGAVCALHQRKSNRTCTRCGNFLCDLCRVTNADHPVCEDCEDRIDPGPARRASRRRLMGFVALAIFGGPVAVVVAIEIIRAIVR